VKFAVRVNQQTVEVDVIEREDGWATVTVEGAAHEVHLQRAGDQPLYSLLVDGTSYEVFVQPQDSGWAIGVETEMFEVKAKPGAVKASDLQPGAAPDGELPIVSPMTGVVVQVRCETGQAIERGDVLLVIEAMKMNNEIRAPRAGTVKTVLVRPGQRVEQHAGLIILA
jgi:biotin carboxyl carrier protein